MHILSDKLWFPPIEAAMEDGLLAIGGDLSVDRLLLAYRQGIFPWHEGGIPLWWSPHPRFVLFPNQLIVAKSMKQIIKNNQFEFTINKDFAAVINACKLVKRVDQVGTWITPAVEQSYIQLHHLGHAQSAETWLDGKLVGGLYGIKMGNLFFGESMFSKISNASKFAFIQYVQVLQNQGVQLIDCQVYTQHLESLGARMISRVEFKQYLATLL